jgi:hypothetical protein
VVRQTLQTYVAQMPHKHFSNQHGTAAKPSSALAGFAIGSVGATANALPLPVAVTKGGEEGEEEENEGDED